MVFLGIGIGAAIVAAGSATYWWYQKRASQRAKPAQQPQKSSPSVAELSSLPESARNKLINAVWYRCENPYCNQSQFLEVHYIVPEIEGGTNQLDNLIVLCSYCHRLADNDEIPLDVMKSWVLDRKDRFKEALDWPYK